MWFFSKENDNHEWKIDLERDLRKTIALNVQRGDRQFFLDYEKKKHDLIPILECIKVDFETFCPEYFVDYQIWDSVTLWNNPKCTIRVDIYDKLSPGLQEFLNCNNLPKYYKDDKMDV